MLFRSINQPSVLLFDEPLSNLDAKLREQMRLEIRRIQQTFGITSIYVTHDQAEAMTVSDRIVVMNEGNIIQIGTPFEIYSRPVNRFVADFIGRVNFFSGQAVSLAADRIEVDFRGFSKTFESWSGLAKEKSNVVVTVRPESLRLHHACDKSSCPLKGTISKIVYLGAVVEYEITCPELEKPVLAVTHNPVEEGFFQSGEEVFIDYNSKAAHVLFEK